MRKTPLVNDNYYHIYNRGVDKRQIFMADEDRQRFLHDLWEFNDKNDVSPFIRRLPKSSMPVGYPTPNSKVTPKIREQLVEIVCFCLMPNHFHLLVKQIKDDGISLYMKKLGTGYSCYFNNKYERSGALFQGRFKSKHIDNDAYLTHLTKYIHLNPVDLIEPEWKEKGLANPLAAKDFLKNYSWSSFKDYVGIKNYPSLIKKDLIMQMIGGEAAYKKFSTNQITSDNEQIKDYLIE